MFPQGSSAHHDPLNSPHWALPWGYIHSTELYPDPVVPSLSPEPVDRPPVLLIANSQNILATYLSGTPVPNITPTSAKQTTAMDFNYVEDTVCWVHVGDSASQTILKCAKIPNLKGFVEERSINISLSLHRECPLPVLLPHPQFPGHGGWNWEGGSFPRVIPFPFVIIFIQFNSFLVCRYEER